MNYKEFCRLKDDGDNFFPKGTEPQEALDILCHHLLGDDYYVVDPVSPKQVNSYIVNDIMISYPSARYQKLPFWKKLWLNLKCFFSENDHIFNYY